MMDATELRRLARDRHQSTPELHAPNDFYGHAAALKRYTGLPLRQPLKAVIEHGIAPIPKIWPIDLRAPFATFLCAGETRARLYKEARPGGRAVAIGPMIRYVGDGAAPPRPRGRLLVFPAHSTHYVKAGYDAAAFARSLAAYRDRFDEIAVCLYWKDVLDGTDAPYRAEGFECVSAGHMFDPGFLPRLRRLIEEADTVVTNRFGSYVVYAVALDRPVWLRKQRVTPVGDAKDIARDSVPAEVDEAATGEIRRIFAEEVDELTPEHRACLEPIAGFEHVRGPEALRSFLDDAAERYLHETTRPRRAGHYLIGRVARPIAERIR